MKDNKPKLLQVWAESSVITQLVNYGIK